MNPFNGIESWIAVNTLLGVSLAGIHSMELKGEKRHDNPRLTVVESIQWNWKSKRRVDVKLFSYRCPRIHSMELKGHSVRSGAQEQGQGIHSMELKELIQLQGSLWFTVNPFNGIESTTPPRAPRTTLKRKESIQWNWKTVNLGKSTCGIPSIRIHSMELKEFHAHHYHPLAPFPHRGIHSMELKEGR